MWDCLSAISLNLGNLWQARSQEEKYGAGACSKNIARLRFSPHVSFETSPSNEQELPKEQKKRHKHRTDIVATIHLHVYNTSVSSMWPHCPLSSGVPTMRKVMGSRKRAKKENNYIQAKQKVDQITDCRHTDGGCRILQHLLGAHDLTCPHYSLPIHCCLFPLGIFLLETFINLIKYIVAILLLHISIEIVPH